MSLRDVDAVVVGAGPAGMSAAIELRAAKISAVVIDEQPAPGGQIYRGAEGATELQARQFGASYMRGAEIIAEFLASGVDYLPGATVVNVDGAYNVDYLADGEMRRIRCKALILATGAYERPMPLPGWTLPGVMSAGAGQVLAKQTGVVPAGSVALVGNGPLLWLLAWQYRRLGVEVSAIVTSSAQKNVWAAVPYMPQFLVSPYLRDGLKYLRDAKRGTRVVKVRKERVRILGTDRAEGVEIVPASGAAQRLEAETVLLHDGVLPSIHLSAAIGCQIDWSDAQQSWRPRTGRLSEASRPGLFIAGDGAGIEGAGAAECTGRLAALGALRHLGILTEAACADAARPWHAARARHLAGRRFLDAWFAPGGPSHWITPETLVCRCEAVSARAARAAFVTDGRHSRHLKSMTRCGMGPCQGRMCQPTLAALGEDQAAGPPSCRFPVKPIPVTSLAGLDTGQRHESDGIRE